MRKRPLVRLGLGLCVALAALAAHPVLPSRAAPRAVYLVDRSDDVVGGFCGPLPNDCSLRRAVALANGDPYATIAFDASRDITLNSPLNLTAAGTLIDSVGLQVSVHLSTTPTVAGNVFKISAEDVTLRGLAIYGSSAGFANIWVTGASTKNVLIQSNRIGLDLNGICASPASSDGIYIDATGTPGTGENLVTIDQNLIDCIISGDGIEINNASKVMVSENQISGANNGLWINLGKDNTARNNRIGSNTTGVRITGNGANDSSSATGNALQLNSISCGFGCGDVLDAGNVGGVLIESGAYLNTVGSATVGQENYILNNTAYGIRVVDSNQNYIGGNFIGATQSGVAAYPNDNGIELLNAAGTFVGPLGPGGRANLISGNNGDGILLSAGSRSSTVIGNIIGPNLALTGTLSNLGSGIRIEAGATSNFIGGSDANPRGLAARPDDNIIGGNYFHGVLIAGATTTSNTIGGNQIGYADNGGTIVALGNPSDGVRLEGSGGGNRVIGAAFAYNVNGIYLNDSGASAIQNSAVYSSIEHGIVLSGALTTQNIIDGGILDGNGLDGLSEKSYLLGNFWRPDRVSGNGGLGIDRIAPNDALDQPTVAISGLMTTITDYDRQAGVITGTGALVPVSTIFGTLYPRIDVYGGASADRDPSGYGEGSAYLYFTTITDPGGGWSFQMLEAERLQFPCVTAIASMPLLGSSEFSNTVCRSTVFVPTVVR